MPVCTGKGMVCLCELVRVWYSCVYVSCASACAHLKVQRRLPAYTSVHFKDAFSEINSMSILESICSRVQMDRIPHIQHTW